MNRTIPFRTGYMLLLTSLTTLTLQGRTPRLTSFPRF